MYRQVFWLVSVVTPSQDTQSQWPKIVINAIIETYSCGDSPGFSPDSLLSEVASSRFSHQYDAKLHHFFDSHKFFAKLLQSQTKPLITVLLPLVIITITNLSCICTLITSIICQIHLSLKLHITTKFISYYGLFKLLNFKIKPQNCTILLVYLWQYWFV